MRFRGRSVQLRLQLAAAAEARRRGYVARPLTADLVVVPAWQDDLDMQVLTIGRLGGRDPAEVFALAAQQLVGGFGLLEQRRTGDGATIWVLRGGNPWVATWLFQLEAWIDANVVGKAEGQWYEPAAGLLVAMPTRSTLYVHLLNTCDAVDATIGALAMTAACAYHHTPEAPWSADIQEMVPRPSPLSPEVFWWRRGKLAVLPTRVDLQSGSVYVGDHEIPT